LLILQIFVGDWPLKRFLLTTASAALISGYAGTAQADCDTVTPGAGDTVTCDADDTRAIINTDENDEDITVILEDGVSVDVSGDAIKISGDGAEFNIGTGAQLTGSDEALVLEDKADVFNLGAIEGGDRAIDADDKLEVYNGVNKDFSVFDTTASITGTREPIKADNDLKVVNYGIITSTEGEGIDADKDADILNYGIIQAFDDAIKVDEGGAVITNYGTIRNTQQQSDFDDDASLEAQDAIDIDSGTINNMAGGEILSPFNAAIDFDPGDAASVINNAGLIKGTLAVTTDVADTQSQTVVNTGAGVLEGTSGTALSLGLGDDTLDMQGGKLIGGADFGAGEDAMTFDAAYIANELAAVYADFGLLHGGLDDDTATFAGVTFGDVSVSGVNGDMLSLSFFGATLELQSWESFVFDDGVQDFASVAALAPVPLPAGVVLMGSGLVLCGALSRRRKQKFTMA
jgi:hypothetical protein